MLKNFIKLATVSSVAGLSFNNLIQGPSSTESQAPHPIAFTEQKFSKLDNFYQYLGDQYMAGEGKSKLILLYADWCKDCRYFEQTWNKLKADLEKRSPWFAKNLEYLAIVDSEYAAAKPFQHNEIPAVYFVDGSKFYQKGSKNEDFSEKLTSATTKFPMETLEAYTDKKIDETACLEQIHSFFDSTVPESKGASPSGPDDSHPQQQNQIHLIHQNFESVLNSPTKMLAILAEHKGNELNVLESADYRNAPVAVYVKERLKLKPGQDVMTLAAKYFDDIDQLEHKSKLHKNQNQNSVMIN